MERKLIDYLPYVIRDYAEFQGIMGSEQPEIEKAWNTTDDLLNNQFIPTAGNMGLSRWEKILGITPKGTDSLEEMCIRDRDHHSDYRPCSPVLCGCGGGEQICRN